MTKMSRSDPPQAILRDHIPGQDSKSIPPVLTSFLGREQEVDLVCALLRRTDVRLITLTGPGGVGKTRLALAAASAVSSDFADGVRFVSLVTVPDHRLVSNILARAVGVQEFGAMPFAEQLRNVSADTETLLVIDNFEHLLLAAPLLIELLVACPRLTLLVTSRERLRLSGEYDVPVMPLAFPDPEYLPPPAQVAIAPAVQLFVERAHSVNPAFRLTVANAAAVAAICHRLDGLPLALELAAARSNHMSPAMLLARLAHRLPLLTGGPRDVPARLQTMHDAISWSYNLLDPTEQRLFRRLAVFAGGFTLEAAEAIAWSNGDEWIAQEHHLSSPLQPPLLSVIDGIASLIDKSLMQWVDVPCGSHNETKHGVEPQLDMLETIREFGKNRLAASGEEDDSRHAHLAYYLDLAEHPALSESDEQLAFDRMESDQANLRAALAWGLECGPPPLALRLAARLGPYWLCRGHQVEGRRWLERALERASIEDSGLRAAALSALGNLQRHLGKDALAKAAWEEARSLGCAAGNRHAELTAVTGLSALAVDVGDEVAATELSEVIVAICRELDDRRGLAVALHNLGWAEASMGNTARAFELFDEALSHARAVSEICGLAHIHNSIGNLRAEQGEFEIALVWLEESLAISRTAHDHRGVSETTVDLGWLALEMGDTGRARTWFAQGLPGVRQVNRQRDTIFAIEGCAVLAAAEGQRSLAMRLVDATVALRVEMALPVEDDPRVTASGSFSARRALRQLAGATSSLTAPTWSLEEALRQVATFVSMSSGPTPSSDPLGVLSVREREVFALLAQGWTDRQISDALYISRRTASKHVSAILAKLGAANRTEAIGISSSNNIPHQ